MAVQFVIGRAGSGKTRRCFEAIVAALRADPLGPPIYWLVPRQATFTAERELTCNSGLDAFCRARVGSFDEFGRDIFDECGGSSIPEITPLGRQMILGHLLRQHRTQLRFFSQVARQPGLAAELDDTFGEFERSGKTADDLAILIADLSESNAADLQLAPLLAKLHDTRLLYEAYTNYLGQERLDPHRRMKQVEAALARCASLRETTIYVDGFLDFTEHERRTLVGVAKARARLEICLTMDPRGPVLADPNLLPDEMSLFRRTEDAFRRLWFAFSEEGIDVDEPIRLETVQRFSSPALGAIERSLFRDPVMPIEDSVGVELIEAPDRASEVDATARKIQSLLRDGLRLRDIGVLVRDLEPYHGLIDASFREHGIPYFVDRRRSASHHPLLQFVRSLFQIARHDWPHDAVLLLMRTGLAGMDLYDADGLENYVLAHRIRGAAGWEAPEPWGFRRRTIGAEDAEASPNADPAKAESLRQPLVDKLLPLIHLLRAEQTASVRDIATEIINTLNRFDVPAALARWIGEEEQASQLERGREHEQVWANLIDLFDQMVDLLGDERMTAAEFNDVMESGLDRFDLALTPPTVDQVLVGQADRTRTGRPKAVFVLGMNEGEFPRPPGDRSILTDRDRRTLRQRRIDLDPGLQQRLLDERLIGYFALTRGSQRLFVSRPLSDAQGRVAEPSSFWRRIVELFPQVQRSVVSPDASPDHIATPRQLVTSLMRWIRGGPDPLADKSDSAWPALYQWLATRRPSGPEGMMKGQECPCGEDGQTRMSTPPSHHKEESHSAIQTVVARAWPALQYTNDAVLTKATAAEAFTAPLQASVSQLETFAACPFRHFAKYTLGLKGRESQEVTVADLGRLYHDLLERALKDVLRRRAAGQRNVTLETTLEQFVHAAAESLGGELMLGSARNRYLLDRSAKVLRRTALAQRELLKRGLFRPRHVGVTFGSGGAGLPALRVSTPRGAEALVHGKIDRVDCVESNGDAAVIDYRLGEGRLHIGSVLHGLSLQLLTYLLVLESNGATLAGKNLDPAAAFYLQLVRRIEDVKHPSEAPDPSDPKWHLKLKPRGLFDRRCLGALDRELFSGQSEVVQAFIKQDGALGRRNTSDVAESSEFRELLKLVAAKLGELADGILSGRIDVTPYRLNDTSPCPRCEYKSVCRFDPAINRYNHLKPIGREEVFGGGAGNE
jgi:ATP-dependent helicase/nuclease subunit B